MLEYIPTTQILDPRRPLRKVDKNSWEYMELVDSIRKDGILQPILVRPHESGMYETVEGAHRLAGAKECRLDVVPCLIKELSDYEVSIIQLKAQAIRPKMRVADFATRLNELIDSGQTTLGALAADVGKSAEWVKGILSLKRLCPTARQAANRGEITIAAAKDLAKLPRGLQEVLLLEATRLDIENFRELCRAHLKEYRELIKTGRIENFVLRIAKPQPHLRSMTEIRQEVDNYHNAGIQIELQGAKTALDGWKACILWLMNLDPISLKEHEERRIKTQTEHATAFERRKLDRDLRRKLLKGIDDDD